MADRLTLDRYYTPPAVPRACVPLLAIGPGSHVVEPSVGAGAWVHALREHVPGVRVSGVDLDPEAAGLALCDDARVGDWPEVAGAYDRCDWVVGNPPFSHAEEHVRASLRVARVGVAMLLRLAFLESAERAPFWREHPAAEVRVFSERPSFTGGKTDSCAYGLFVWRAGVVETRLRWLSWRAA